MKCRICKFAVTDEEYFKMYKKVRRICTRLMNFCKNVASNCKRNLFVTYPPFGHTESLSDIQAGVHFSLDFMRRQDEGGWHTAKAPTKKLKILTDAAKSADKLPTVHIGKKGKRVSAQTKRDKVRHTIQLEGSHKANRVARAAAAYKTGLLMYLGSNRSLFKVTDFQAVDGHVKFRAQLFINRKYTKTYTPARRFFKPACEKAQADMQTIFYENIDKCMKEP